MHLLVREQRTLDEQAEAYDPDHPPADIVVLSFSDSDLASLAAVHDGEAATLRAAPLGLLRHPMSVDLYLERTVAGSRCVLVRLLGGLDYWRYGAEELSALCRRAAIPLAMLPGDGRPDPALAALSTVAPDALRRLHGFLREGGPANHRAAMRLLAHLAGCGADDGAEPEPVPPFGIHRRAADDARPLATVIAYRAHLMADDIAPAEALCAALEARGLRAELLHVSSLKEPAAAAFVSARLAQTRPRVVLNATFFSAKGEDGSGSPLDRAGVPVLQLLQPSCEEAAWSGTRRGLGQSDLAMQVVLPELDGRLSAGAISFKAARDGAAGLMRNQPHADGIALVADRALGWSRLAGTERPARRVAILLSDYPAIGGQVAHAVGLDGFASLRAILLALHRQGYDTGGPPPGEAALVRALCHEAPRPILSAAEYRALFDALPEALRQDVSRCWGEPKGGVSLRHLRLGRVLVAVQPDRGDPASRKADYHDPALPPCHRFLGAHLWLRQGFDAHALLQLGAHGTLEWLPGKAAAPSAACAPSAILRGLPVIYPFIVNDPGEAAAAKRRLGAATIGHLTPPIGGAAQHGEALLLERLIDDYAAADGLDERRGRILREQILDRAEQGGVLRESGAERRSADDPEALARLDAFLCDVKELQIRDGLHVFGRPPPARDRLLDAILRGAGGDADRTEIASRLDASPAGEMAALLRALDGGFVSPGPAGAPSRGRADVLPTGRNPFSVDPRAIPTRAATLLAERAAATLLERHRQENGDWLRTAMIDLWGSTSLRTGGEDLALALLLMGVQPEWDPASGRVAGFQIVPLPLLDRPRVDVTLRISGMFRDAFPGQIALFDQAVSALAAREEDADWNRLSAAARGLQGAERLRATARIWGAAPGSFGAGIERALAEGAGNRDRLGALYLDHGGHCYGGGRNGEADRTGFAHRVADTEALIHVQDQAETDLLDGLDVAAHAGGFAAARALCGGGAAAALYHADTSRPDAPRLRLAAEEVARVVRGRAANPDWIAGMKRHGYRGAAEIAGAVHALHGFAALLPERFDAQFELLFAATLGDADTRRFLMQHNPDAAEAMRARFSSALERGLWRPRRNDLEPLR